MARYIPTNHYLSAGLFTVGLALFSAWTGERWPLAYFPAFAFLLCGVGILFLAFQPRIVIEEDSLSVGAHTVAWGDIRRVDRVGFDAPVLVLRLTLSDNRRVLLVHPGDFDSANQLLRQVRRGARAALLDGVPYRQFWGEMPNERRVITGPRYHLLRPDDEADVERLYQRLKAVGHLDPKKADDK